MANYVYIYIYIKPTWFIVNVGSSFWSHSSTLFCTNFSRYESFASTFGFSSCWEKIFYWFVTYENKIHKIHTRISISHCFHHSGNSWAKMADNPFHFKTLRNKNRAQVITALLKPRLLTLSNSERTRRKCILHTRKKPISVTLLVYLCFNNV